VANFVEMKDSKKACDLSACLLCRLSLKEWLPAIQANRRNIAVKKGELIFTEGATTKGIYFVSDGLVKVHKKWDEEKDLIVRFAKKGDILGHRGLGTSLFYSVSATALENSVLCFLDNDFFTASLKINTGFSYQLLLFFADELKESEHRMRNLAHMSVKGRLAEGLIHLSNKFGRDEKGHINITLSRQDLAAYIGTTYETAFRMLTELVNDEIVQVDGKQIKIINEQALKNMQNL